MFTRRNNHFYATENPHLIHEVRHQYRFTLNIWCGLLNNKSLGPYFINGNLTVAKYVEIIEEMLDDLPIRYRRNSPWFQRDGCGPHNSRIVTDYLNRTFPDSWIGTRGPVAWPARSPDLNPLDFYLLGYLKNIFYDTANPTTEILREKIENVLEGIQGDEISKCIRSMGS
ncbi:hypothetical protein JTB14_016577 [Gonioctena quinquepunctata]|nr:hypothetical protein JTB14_016577 [Gonioctena quinquepunctata]